MERNNRPVVHNCQYMNRSLCGVILTPYAFVSNNINELTCQKCKKIALAWKDQRYIVRGLKVVK